MGPAPELEEGFPVAATPPVAPVDAAVGAPNVLDDLRLARDALVAAIALVRADDPARLGPLVRELRETWKALATTAEPVAQVEDEFAAARRRRAAMRGE